MKQQINDQIKENIKNIISKGSESNEQQASELIKAQKILSNLQKIQDYNVTQTKIWQIKPQAGAPIDFKKYSVTENADKPQAKKQGTKQKLNIQNQYSNIPSLR